MTHPVLKEERGNALLLSVLILLSLTSVLVVGVQRTNSDLMVAGNLVRSNQAYMAGEAGTVHGQALVGRFVNKYISQMQVNGSYLLPLATMGTSMDAMTDTNPDLPYDTCLPYVDATDSADRELARVRQELAYHIRAEGKGDGPPVAGNEPGTVCYQVFDFDVPGGMISTGKTAAEVQTALCVDDTVACVRDTVVVKNRARVLAGPTVCSKPN